MNTYFLKNFYKYTDRKLKPEQKKNIELIMQSIKSSLEVLTSTIYITICKRKKNKRNIFLFPGDRKRKK